MRPRILFPLLLLLLTQACTDRPASTQGVVDNIKQALKTGNATLLSEHFNNAVSLTLPGYENIYSHQQARMILEDFFRKFPPRDFSIVHQGASKDGSQYSIGLLKTAKKEFRVYFLLKDNRQKLLIHQLRFEPEN
jgi:hypothetical protein